MLAIDAQNIGKTFGKGKRKYVAIADLTLKVRPNQMFGLLGSNGAGKTTFLSILATTLNPNKGTIKIYGKDLQKDLFEIRNMMSVCSGYSGLFDELTVLENLYYYARMRKIKNMEKRTKELMNLVGLKEQKDTIASDLSTGMRQRLSIAIALVSKPKLLLLDEPTAGLDPIIAAKIRNNLKKVQKKLKMTIILTTHNMAEAEQLCDNVALMKDGKVLAVETVEKLKEKLGGYQIIEVKTEKPITRFRSKGVIAFKKLNGTTIIQIRDVQKNIHSALSKLYRYGINKIVVRELTLEELFLAYVK